MHDNDRQGAQARPVWAFMVATAMATTISTLAATAMVQADSTEPAAVTCACEAPAVAPLVAAPPVQQVDAPVQAEAPVQQAETPAPAVDPTPKAEVDGALDKDLIRRIVRAHIDEVRYCYNEGLEHDPELAGRVVVDFVIGSEGKVTRSTADSDMEGEVPECIAKAVNGWLFPRPADGEDVSVKYPFVLEPG
jgi:outer membrane biosynthesis protein TonB